MGDIYNMKSLEPLIHAWYTKIGLNFKNPVGLFQQFSIIRIFNQTTQLFAFLFFTICFYKIYSCVLFD